ncbi:MAG: hypothetical protein ACD_63C00076G0004 [uncultured bacterium]|nr:MAG: hypothetical protein ACD_63C00076G0004 [uncultured bacterium]
MDFMKKKIYFDELAILVSVVFFIWLGVLVFFAELGWLSKLAIFAVTIVAVAISILWVILGPKRIFLTKKDFLIVVIILLICVFVGIFHHSFPFGRDPAGYVSAALKIFETNSLSFSGILTRPFHGFTNLGNDVFTSQFLPAYNVYLTSFYAFGGLSLMFWANVPILFLTLCLVFLIAKRLSSYAGGIVAVLLLSFFYSFLWFARQINSENLFMLSMICSIAFLVYGIRRRSLGYLILGFFPSTFSILIRGEGIPYIIFYAIAFIAVLVYLRKQLLFKNAAWVLFVFPLMNFVIFQIYITLYGGGYVFGQGGNIIGSISGFTKTQFFWLEILGLFSVIFIFSGIRFIIKKCTSFKISFWKLYLGLFFWVLLVFEILFWIWSKSGLVISWDFYRSQYVFEIFHLYLLTVFFVIIFLAVYKKVYQRLTYLVIFVALPSAVFIVDPFIALDNPWFMRRFFAVFIPVVFMLTAIGLVNFKLNKKAFIAVAMVLLAINIGISFPILTFSENKGVEMQLKNLGDKFTDKDIVLMTPGWQWQQWAYYLYFYGHKNFIPSSEGFENKEEFLELLSQYDNVYVLSDRNYSYHPMFSDKELEFVESVDLKYPAIVKTIWGLAGKLEEAEGNLNIAYIHRQQIGTPPRETSMEELKLHIFKVRVIRKR